MPFWTFREHRGGNEEHIHCLSSGQEKHHSGLAFTCFSGKDGRAFSRSLTQNRKLFGRMPAFSTKRRSAKFNFTPRISWDLGFFFFFTQRTQISIFTSVQGVLDPAAYYESYFPPNVLYLCLKVHVYNSVIMCSVRHMSKKNTLAICFSSAISKLLRNLLFRKQINIYCFTIFGHIWWGRHHRQCSCWI